MRRTKIICTIGPASESEETLEKLMHAGMNIARLNFSHGDHEEHLNRIKRIRKVSKKLEKHIGILLDTKGPEIRTHNMKDGVVHLVKNQKLAVHMNEVLGDSEKISISYNGLIHDVKVGDEILIDDGIITLKIDELDYDNEVIHTTVLNEGEVKNKKGVNVPQVKVNLPSMTEKDESDILFGIENEVDFIAPSFIRKKDDVLKIRELLEGNNGSYIKIIPKIENQEGIDNIDEILLVSDGLMVARGDLGVEIPTEAVPLAQKELIKKCNFAGKPVITATQMLDSMQHNPRCTRAEASDVANAIYDGSDAVMLSGETAAGEYPVEAVTTMANIATSSEAAQDYKKLLSDRTKVQDTTVTTAIGVSAAHTALNLNCRAIVAATESGHTAKMISKYRPQCDIIAVTPYDYVARQLELVWGVQPIVAPKLSNTDEVLNGSVQSVVEKGYANEGDLIIITAGVPTGQAGTTNLMKLHVVGDTLITAQGIGKLTGYGEVVMAKSYDELAKIDTTGKIVLLEKVDGIMTPHLVKAAGLITVEGGLTSPGAIVGLNLELPTIVGATDAFDILKPGMKVTVDSEQHVVYSGHADVL
ncbi:MULTISPECIES: pyruvate kinase [Nosocomiicoccus]|uniref:pyruvate kinase n=1 Tax=Nosocomiicoccus TaxID=489909 RepID=UPI0008348E16|nr:MULTISPECIES: pyruvate kinase [Nosocomiicoccus]MDK6863162.1 pyruvate kinase [Nosocomiicoccus ampullae]OFO55754.1 pyruvate kinase [Nosocomiicoccus sp. HMSC059G07]OFS63897.1 pyruvate kinase [Nosocomiicoccus sp. HMSC09A07]